MTNHLRPYQAEAVSAVYDYFRHYPDHALTVIPTAGGKTHVIAQICRDVVTLWGDRIIIVAHVKELLQQAEDKLRRVAPELWHHIGIYSAGLGQRDTDKQIIIAGVQSIYKRAHELGKFDVMIIDEAHMIPPDGEGMYRTLIDILLESNPNMRIVGLTATPYRTTSGMLCGDDGLFKRICYEVGVKELLSQGYLSKPIGKIGRAKADLSGVKIKRGDFVEAQMAEVMDTEELVSGAVREIIERTEDRHSCLIFACTIDHALHIQSEIESRGQECGFVCGETLPFEREDTLKKFSSMKLKYLVNVNVLTTGYDAPCIDAVALLRATMSPGLFYQMVGRGFRIDPSKEDFLLMDFGGNLRSHGPVHLISETVKRRMENKDRPAPSPGDEDECKECPGCQTAVERGVMECPECGHQWPSPVRKANHDVAPDNHDPLDEELNDTEWTVSSEMYSVHTKRGAGPDDPRTLRVDYICGLGIRYSEWVCFEHTGYAHAKAVKWWRSRSDAPIPTCIEEAIDQCERGMVAGAVTITVRVMPGKPFPSIIKYTIGPKPEYVSYKHEAINEDAEDDDWIEIGDEPSDNESGQGKIGPLGFMDFADDDIPF